MFLDICVLKDCYIGVYCVLNSVFFFKFRDVNKPKEPVLMAGMNRPVVSAAKITRHVKEYSKMWPDPLSMGSGRPI
jgi:hypothetical protein